MGCLTKEVWPVLRSVSDPVLLMNVLQMCGRGLVPRETSEWNEAFRCVNLGLESRKELWDKKKEDDD